MHKFRYLTVLLLILLMGGVGSNIAFGAAVEKGVPYALAELRRAQIGNLRYELHFDVPSQRQEPVRGRIAMLFELQKPEDVVVDFRCTENIQGVKVNGKSISCDMSNEHVIVPAASLREGENRVEMEFVPEAQSLNRNDGYLYTLLVPDRARTVFPCFDQPSLKARYTLTLNVDSAWVAVSNTPVKSEKLLGAGRREIQFATTEPLSTYLFSFVTGKFFRRECEEGNHKFSAYYRETDPARVAQIPEICSMVALSLRWLEEFTGVPYPFAKYDFVILPGFQFGGMEHTGATLYNDGRMFLPTHPTADEVLSRAELIAHETSHMWFGDYVTMDWFSDVWTKEVMANYFGAKISEPLVQGVDHSLQWQKSIVAAALSQDRTAGRTAVRQSLDNLERAGLVYNNIIYNKAPVVLKKFVELMGEDDFRGAIGEYLRTYGYGNASWGELVEILDRHCAADLKSFSKAWIEEPGMPEITLHRDGNMLKIRQKLSPSGLVMRQRFELAEIDATGNVSKQIVDLEKEEICVPLNATTQHVICNTDGRFYGLIVPEKRDLDFLLKEMAERGGSRWTASTRQALWMQLHEQYEALYLSESEWRSAVIGGLEKEDNELVLSTLVSYLGEALGNAYASQEQEAQLLSMAENHPKSSCRRQLTNTLAYSLHSPVAAQHFLQMWQKQSSPLLSERDYTNMAYELAVRLPEQAESILATQRSRIENPDRQRQFDFISRAVSPRAADRQQLFADLMKPENRRVEPWAKSALAYLNHPLREQSERVSYVLPALELLPEIQRTGDIFFPAGWSSSLLASHRSPEVFNIVEDYLQRNSDMNPLLRNKVLEAAYPLFRAQKRQATR